MFLRRTLPTFLLALSTGYADILILRDGSQIRGSFNFANATQITLTDDNGRRRTVEIRDVQELRFAPSAPAGNYGPPPNPSNYPGPGNPSYGAPPPPTGAMVDDLDRLRQDLRSAMDNNNLPPDQRQSLEDARGTLNAAAQQARMNRPIAQRNVRLAMDSIRNASDRMQRDDRSRLNDDIRRLSASMGGQPGRDY